MDGYINKLGDEYKCLSFSFRISLPSTTSVGSVVAKALYYKPEGRAFGTS
jgi:hypothetical protein